MNVTIKVIPHREQRYETVGDWYYDADGSLSITVSKMNDWRYEMLVAIHELVEVVLCRHSNVTQSAVDEFDREFEKNRLHGDHSEPGDDPKAPYRTQHFIATTVERIVALALFVNWREYEDEVNSL